MRAGAAGSPTLQLVQTILKERNGIEKQRQELASPDRDYVEDLQSEMKRVTWPTWKQVRATTTVVVIFDVSALPAISSWWMLCVNSIITRIIDLFTK